MADSDPLLWLACALGAASVALLRFAWSLPKRNARWNAAGWGLLVASVAAAWSSEGAWGTAIAGLVTIGAAFIALTFAALKAPPGRAQPSNRRVGMLPQGSEPRRIGRRLGTFLLVTLGGLTASLALALTLRGVGGSLGWNEADTLVLALFSVPLSWAILASVLLMQEDRQRQVVTLLACGVPAVPVLLFGVA
jgi:hypothetical protein